MSQQLLAERTLRSQTGPGHVPMVLTLSVMTGRKWAGILVSTTQPRPPFPRDAAPMCQLPTVQAAESHREAECRPSGPVSVMMGPRFCLSSTTEPADVEATLTLPGVVSGRGRREERPVHGGSWRKAGRACSFLPCCLTGHTCFSITSMSPGLGLQVLFTPTPPWRGHT